MACPKGGGDHREEPDLGGGEKGKAHIVKGKAHIVVMVRTTTKTPTLHSDSHLRRCCCLGPPPAGGRYPNADPCCSREKKKKVARTIV